MVSQCAAEGPGQEAQHVLHVRVERRRLLTHDLQHSDRPSRPEHGRTDHGACTYSAAGIPVDPGILFGVVTTQDPRLGDTESGQAARAAQARPDILTDRATGAAIDHFLAVYELHD